MPSKPNLDPDLPNYVFGAMDVMPLVELCNEAYELGRQHPSIQPVLKPWMRKFAEFFKAHQYTEPPEGAVKTTDNKYVDLARGATVQEITNKMKDKR